MIKWEISCTIKCSPQISLTCPRLGASHELMGTVCQLGQWSGVVRAGSAWLFTMGWTSSLMGSNGWGLEEVIGVCGGSSQGRAELASHFPHVSPPSFTALDILFHDRLYFLLGLPSQFQGIATSSTGAVWLRRDVLFWEGTACSDYQ